MPAYSHALLLGIIDTERARALVGSTGSAASGERLDPNEIAKVGLK